MRLNNWSRSLIVVLAILTVLMTMILGFHWFGPTILSIGKYSQLFGALLGGVIAIISVNIPIRFGEEAEPWLGNERLAWTLVGLGSIMWGLGECVYRYLLAQNLPNFPALSDVGYSALPPLIFIGLLLQPAPGSGRGRMLVVLDSLISMGSILAIAWFLLLGSMALAPGEANLAKFLGLYYPISDMALLSCVVFLIVRGQGRVYESNARRISLLLVGIGICVFAVSDFNYNIQNNMSTYIDGTWADLGWPIGLMIIGLGAHLRRFIPATSGDLVEERVRQREERVSFGPAELLPYLLLCALFFVLTINVLSNDPTQVWQRPVLLVTTLCVVVLVIIRQLNTQLENERLSHRQAGSLERLARANARVEDQARQIAEHSTNLEEGINHLKEVQAQIANGNLRARARIGSGNLISLAGSLNLMADRLLRFEQIDTYARKLTRALNDLSRAFEQYRLSGNFVLPVSCNEFLEIQRLLISMGMTQNQSISNAEPGFANPMQPAKQHSTSRPLGNTERSASKSLSNPPRSASQALSNSERSASKSLSNPPRSANQAVNGLPQQKRSPSAPLPTRKDANTSQQLGRPNSSDPARPSGAVDEFQLDFPSLPRWGND